MKNIVDMDEWRDFKGKSKGVYRNKKKQEVGCCDEC